MSRAAITLSFALWRGNLKSTGDLKNKLINKQFSLQGWRSSRFWWMTFRSQTIQGLEVQGWKVVGYQLELCHFQKHGVNIVLWERQVSERYQVQSNQSTHVMAQAVSHHECGGQSTRSPSPLPCHSSSRLWVCFSPLDTDWSKEWIPVEDKWDKMG